VSAALAPSVSVPSARVPAAPAQYRVSVTHARTERVRHAFRYSQSMWLIDLDDVPRLRRGFRWLASFEARDHLGDPERSLRANLDAYLESEGVTLDGGRIVALTNARALGYVFNPLTMYWCHGPSRDEHPGEVRAGELRAGELRAGELRAVVAEVHNTHGERHCYLLRPGADDRDTAAKAFPVSPFFTVDGHYAIRCPEPGDSVDLSITLHRGGRPVFTARVAGKRENAGRSVLVQALRRPLASHRVMALIRFEGLRLWFRRVPIVARPIHVAQESAQ